MRRRDLVAMLGATAVLPLAAAAEQTAKLHRIGLLSANPADDPVAMELLAAFVEGLRELGWIEGTNVVFERRYAANRPERLPELAQEIVRLNVDVIVTPTTTATLAAKQATTTIPIVMTNPGDPLGSGLVESLARPGGNVTGLSTMGPDTAGKRLQLLRQLLPQVSHVAVIWNATNPYATAMFRETERAAQVLGIIIQSLEVRSPDDFERAFEAMQRQQPEAMIPVTDPLTTNFRQQIVDFAATHRLPAIYGVKEFAKAGGLMAYGTSLRDLNRRAASYVDKLLRGAKPGDLPIEQATKFELVLNLKTAKALGLTIPPSILAIADEVIE
jgi:putative ABC transport system substrate-binding protein